MVISLSTMFFGFGIYKINFFASDTKATVIQKQQI